MGAHGSSSDVFFVRRLGPGVAPDLEDPTIVDLDPPTLEESLGIREIRRAIEQALRTSRSPERSSATAAAHRKPRRATASARPRPRSVGASLALIGVVVCALALTGYGERSPIGSSSADAPRLAATAAPAAPAVAPPAAGEVPPSPSAAPASAAPESPLPATRRHPHRPR